MDAAQLLLAISMMLGVQREPLPTSDWEVVQPWGEGKNLSEFVATSSALVEECKVHPTYNISFPQVIHGVHQLRSDGTLIYESGDPTFQTASSFYEKPSLACRKIMGHSKLEWRVVSYSKFFARVSSFPKLEASTHLDTIFNLSSNFIAAGSLALLSVLLCVLFLGKIRTDSILSITIGSGLLSVYFALTVAPLFGLSLSMLGAHRIADTAIWLGIALYTNFFRLLGYLGKKEYLLLLLSIFAATLVIWIGNDGDGVQLGTSIPFLTSIICLLSILGRSIAKNIVEPNKDNYLVGLANFVFVVAGTNDILHIAGLIDSYSLLPLGIASAIFITSLLINREIQKIYDHRNDLLNNLEKIVEEKTNHLSAALQNLKLTQAELIQSARLASLGTLSAGIAHEINNSINYVNGALQPLEKMLEKSVNSTDLPKAKRLFDAIKHGTGMTVDIVRSLRTYTGLNHAPKKDVNLLESVQSILTILKSKIKNQKISVEIEPNINLFCQPVSLNQIFMNIISNAIDAMPQDSGFLKISALTNNTEINVEISDNGCGISAELLSRIFDPFFTTKEIGKGTGLGLHIVKKEIETLNGKMSVKSALGTGTTFFITLPVKDRTENQEAA